MQFYLFNICPKLP